MGGGHDIYISDNCNFNKMSGSNYGYTYKLPSGIKYFSKEAKGYLAGSKNFKVIDIETYSVKY